MLTSMVCLLQMKMKSIDKTIFIKESGGALNGSKSSCNSTFLGHVSYRR